MTTIATKFEAQAAGSRRTARAIVQATSMALLLALGPVTARADRLYINALQTEADLENWLSTRGDARIATAPDGSSALSFSGTAAGGDLYAAGGDWFVNQTGSFTLSFEVLGHCGAATSGCGAFVLAEGAQGNAGGWILADTPYFGLPTFSEAPGQWQKVSYTFGGYVTNLGFENWVGSPQSGPYSFFLRNVRLTDNPEQAAIGSLSVSAVPEPGSAWLMGLGALLLLAGAARPGAGRPRRQYTQRGRAAKWAMLAAALSVSSVHAQQMDLNFDDNQLPAGWTLHSVMANNQYGFAGGRFYAAEVDSSAYIETAVASGAASWTVSWETELFQTVYGNFTQVQWLDGLGHALSVSLGSASYNYGNGLHLLIDDGVHRYEPLLALQAGLYRLSATFTDDEVRFTGVLAGASGDVPVFAETLPIVGTRATSVSALRLQVYETLGPPVWIDNVHIAAVPEPAAAATLLVGLVPLLVWARRRGTQLTPSAAQVALPAS